MSTCPIELNDDGAADPASDSAGAATQDRTRRTGELIGEMVQAPCRVTDQTLLTFSDCYSLRTEKMPCKRNLGLHGNVHSAAGRTDSFIM